MLHFYFYINDYYDIIYKIIQAILKGQAELFMNILLYIVAQQSSKYISILKLISLVNISWHFKFIPSSILKV